jgi:hypothetical protein
MKKNFLIVIFSISLVYLTNLVTYNYTIQATKSDLVDFIKNCDPKENLNSHVKVSLMTRQVGFRVLVSNNSKCFSVNELQLNIKSYNKGVQDTITLNITEKIDPKFNIDINVNEIENDSLFLINYKINNSEFKFN